MNDDITVIHGDCLEVMPTLDLPARVAVVTDPPYGIEHESNHGATWQGRQILGDGDSALSDWIIGWAKTRGIPWAVFGNWKCQRPDECRGVLIWDKGPAFGMGDLSFPWKPSWEEIYIGGDGWTGKRDEGVLRGHIVVSWETKGRKHPHQKPVSLMTRILSKLPADVLVLDPFAGSGATAVACLKSGRRCITIEKDPQYIPIIRRRLADAATPLFS